MFPEWPYVKKLSLSYLSDEGNNKIAALDIPMSLSSNFGEEDKVLYWLFKRDFTDIRLYNLTKDEEVTHYGIAGILPQSGKIIVIGKFPHISSHDEILMYYGNRNAGNIVAPELNVPMQPLEDECCVCYYMLDGKGYPDSVVEVLWKNNGYWEGNYQYTDVGNTKFAVGNTDGVPVVNFPNQFTDNNTLPFSITYCVTEFPSDQKWMGCIPKYDNDITFYMEGNTFIIATASETLVNMPIPELTSGQFQFVYIGVGKDTAEYRVYDVNKQLIGQGTVSANMTQTLTYQTTCLAGGYYDLNQSSCVKTGTAVVGRFRLFQRLLSQYETDILVDKDHYDNDYAYIDLRVDSTTMSIFNHETVSFGGMIENPYNSLESLDEDNICVTLFDPSWADSPFDTGVIISHKCPGDDNFSIQAGGWTIYNISGINPDCKRFPFYTIYTSSSTRWLPGHRYVAGYSVPAIATHLKFGFYDESINFKKTAGVNINGTHLESIDYENIIDSDHTSTTSEIYIDYNKIELQEGDLLKTNNDEYFQVQSINHDGDSYRITPDHTLSQPPNEVYFIGHRAIGYKASINKQKVINNISVSEQTQDIINPDVPSTTHKIYINNQLINVKPGDVFNADNNELFEVAVVDNEECIVYASSVRTIACGHSHTVIIKDDGSVWVTGSNGNGQLGLGDTSNRNQFTDTGMTAKQVACGDFHTVIIREDGSVWVTGENNYGQLGLGDTSNRNQFTDTGMTARYVACGYSHTVIIKDDDSVWSTGLNDYGQLGLGNTNNRTQFTDTGITAKSVACGYQHTVIIRDDNSVWGTGRNNYGQLGLGNTSSRTQFTNTGITAKFVDCGMYHTVIIKEDDSVWGTGNNYHGELGLGTTYYTVQFTNTGITAKQVACGGTHTVIIRDDNSVWVTGRNGNGQLGLGDTTDRHEFTNTGLTAKQVACGREHTVIIRDDSSVWSTGWNGSGQLGLGDTNNRNQFTDTGVTAKLYEKKIVHYDYIVPTDPLSQPPTSVYPVSKFNVNGIQLQSIPTYDSGTGVQTYTFRNIILNEPSNVIKLLVDMSDVTTITDISINLESDPVGDWIEFTKTVGVDTSNNKLESTSYENIIDSNHTSTTSEIYIDYNKIELQEGDLLKTDNDEYFQVQSINHDRGMYSVVPDHTLNTPPNKVYFLGHRAIVHKSCMNKQRSVVNIKAVECPQDVIDSNNPSTANKIYINNQLIDVKPGDIFNTNNNELFEVAVVDNDGNVAHTDNVRLLACGGYHTVIIKEDNSVWVTGRNNYGQLGLGDTNDRHEFTNTGVTAKFVACGFYHTAIIRDDNLVWVTGINDRGQLGLGDTNNRYEFTNTGLTAKQVACGGAHTVIIKDDDSVWVTGLNNYGQLGLGDTNNRYEFTNTGIIAKQVACGDGHTVIIREDGSVWVTGQNNYGQLGLGDTNDRHEFTNTALTATQVACGTWHTAIIKNDGSVWTTGRNDRGQLGLGDTNNRHQFTNTDITAKFVACGDLHTVIIRDDNFVWATGDDYYGQLGLGDTTQRNQFTDTGITAKFVACGEDHTVIIKDDGSVWVTGVNWYGQLGLGDTNDRNRFTDTGVTAKLSESGSYYTKYWVIPNNPLSQPPTAVYPVSKFSVDGISLHSPPIYNADIGMQFYTFQGIALPNPNDVVKFSVDIFEGTTVNKILIDLVSDIDPRFGSGKMLMIFAKTAGTDVEEGKLKPIDYENIIDPNHTSTTTKIYIDYNKIELQEGDLLKTDNDEHFQVQSINRSGTVYYITPDHTLDNPPNEVYFIGHRGIAFKEFEKEQQSVNITVSEQTQNVIDPYHTSIPTKIYINNKLITARPGDVFSTSDGELFEVAVVDNDGNVACIDCVKMIACGYSHTVIVREDGSVWSTGDNSYGQLGLGDTNDRNQFTDTGITAKFVACGAWHTVVIRDDGSVWTTGYDGNGQLGLGGTYISTQFTATNMTAKFVACGDSHTVIIRDDNSVWSTGNNWNGQLGLGDTDSRNQFTNTGLTAKFIACGSYHTVMIREDDSVWSTGSNWAGQLGLGDTNDRHQFTNTGMTAKYVACGDSHTVIIKDDDLVWATGYNGDGQLGLGDTNDRYQFINTGITAKQVACGYSHTVIIREDSSVWGTGANSTGQLGLGDTTGRHQFTSTGITAKQVACGSNHTVIIKDNGSVWGTGYNGSSQLGLGDTNDRYEFVWLYGGSDSYYMKYWVIPNNPLSKAPVSVYPVSKFNVNGLQLQPDPVYDPKTGMLSYIFSGINLPAPSNTIKLSVDISSVTVITEVLLSLSE